MKNKILTINLPESLERRSAIDKQALALDLEIEYIDAVDGRKLSVEKQEQLCDLDKIYYYYGAKLNPGEIGCALSHIKCYNEIIEQNLDGALILEDDAVLHPDFKKIFTQLLSHTDKSNPDVILMHYHRYYSERDKIAHLFKDFNLYNTSDAYREGLSTVGYYVTYNAAQILVNYHSKLKHPCDYWNDIVKNTHINLQIVVPFCIDYRKDISSTINQDRTITHPHLYRKKISKLQKYKKSLSKRFLYHVKKQPTEML